MVPQTASWEKPPKCLDDGKEPEASRHSLIIKRRFFKKVSFPKYLYLEKESALPLSSTKYKHDTEKLVRLGVFSSGRFSVYLFGGIQCVCAYEEEQCHVK